MPENAPKNNASENTTDNKSGGSFMSFIVLIALAVWFNYAYDIVDMTDQYPFLDIEKVTPEHRQFKELKVWVKAEKIRVETQKDGIIAPYQRQISELEQQLETTNQELQDAQNKRDRADETFHDTVKTHSIREREWLADERKYKKEIKDLNCEVAKFERKSDDILKYCPPSS